MIQLELDVEIPSRNIGRCVYTFILLDEGKKYHVFIINWQFYCLNNKIKTKESETTTNIVRTTKTTSYKLPYSE